MENFNLEMPGPEEIWLHHNTSREYIDLIKDRHPEIVIHYIFDSCIEELDNEDNTDL